MPPFPQLTKELQFAGAFPYRANLGSLIEHELDHVFLYYPSEELIAAIHAQPGEVEALYWISIETLDRMQSECPQEFTAWFWQAYRTVRGAISVSF